MISDLRAYWDAQPCNANHSNAESGSREYFEQVRKRKYFVEPHIPDFAQFQHWRGKRVLDLGCGLGTMAVDFALDGADITALDFSSESLFLAAQNFHRHDLNGLLVNANIEERLVYLSGFDLVFAFGVLHHTPRPERAIANVYHYLKPGGEFRLMVYHKWSTKAAAVALGLARPEAQAGCPLARTYTRRGIRRLLKRAGFRIISMRVDHIFPWRIADYKAYRYVKARPWRWLPVRAFRWLEKHLGWHLLVVARKD